jgi:hypothetical protein
VRAKHGGGNRVRTGGPELAKLVLYQLSYAPAVVPRRRTMEATACVLLRVPAMARQQEEVVSRRGPVFTERRQITHGRPTIQE